jgi:hypothetical protein
MSQQLAFNGTVNQILLFEILDSIVGVAANRNDDLWLEQFNCFAQIIEADLLECRLGVTLVMIKGEVMSISILFETYL